MQPVPFPQVIELIRLAVVLVAVVAAGFSVVATLAVWHAGKHGASSYFRMFERLQVLQLLTVMLVIAAATVLALFGILDSNGVVGILSGVAGYVLGGLNRQPAPATKPVATEAVVEQKAADVGSADRA